MTPRTAAFVGMVAASGRADAATDPVERADARTSIADWRVAYAAAVAGGVEHVDRNGYFRGQR